MKRLASIVFVVALAAALLLFLWCGPEAEEPATMSEVATPDRADPRPATSGRALRASEPAVPGEPTPAAAEEAAPVRISVGLGGLSTRSTLVGSVTLFRPSDWWPLPDEDPLTGSEAAGLLQGLLDQEAEGISSTPEAESPFIAAARTEAARLGEGLSREPWRLLLLAEAERRAAVRSWLEENNNLQLDPDVVPEWLPEIDYGPVEAAARSILDAHPESGASDFARLYLLEAVGDGAAAEHDPDVARTTAFEVLAASSDPVVNETALRQLSNLGRWVRLSPEELAIVAREVELLPQERRGRGLCAFGLTQAFALEDWDAAARWLARYEAAPLPDHEPSRRSILADQAVARGQLAVARGEVTDDWRSRLVADVWRCHTKTPFTLENTVEARGTWDGGWSWTRWGKTPEAFRTCVEAATEDHPEPPVGEVVLALFLDCSWTSAGCQ